MKPQELSNYQWETMIYYTKLFLLLGFVSGLAFIFLLIGICIERGVI